MVKQYGTDAYIKGYRVYTTIDSGSQAAANKALRKALLAYDFRHGYRGPEKNFEGIVARGSDEWDRLLADVPVTGGLTPGLVVAVQEKSVQVYRGKGEVITLEWDGLKWARPAEEDNKLGPVPKKAADILKPGDLIRLSRDQKGRWKLTEIPEVSGAIVALNPKDGAVLALVGGFDYFHSKFNRVIQAQRQPGSSFKPFIYSAALEKGFTPASLINDAPVVFKDSALEGTWRPENYSGKFYGPTRIREALIHSRNLVSIRLLRAMGINYAIKHLSRFSIPRGSVRRDLTLALGSGSITPMQLATAYAVFANGGFGISSYFIDRIETDEGEVLFTAKPKIACPKCEKAEAAKKEVNPAPDEPDENTGQPKKADGKNMEAEKQLVPEEQRAKRVLDARNAYQIYSMMRDVIRHGTGRKALVLGRTDLAGKTGTTNDQRDAWFSGFNREIVASAWVGFDKVRPLGNRETGGRAALPMWIDFMAVALKGIPDKLLEQPEGLVTVRIDPETGLLAGGESRNAIFEIFRSEYIPKKRAEAGVSGPGMTPDKSSTPGPDIIF
jgi:penicillin-binding protein 1A